MIIWGNWWNLASLSKEEIEKNCMGMNNYRFQFLRVSRINVQWTSPSLCGLHLAGHWTNEGTKLSKEWSLLERSVAWYWAEDVPHQGPVYTKVVGFPTA